MVYPIPLAVYADDQVVGFTMYCFDPENGTGYLDRLMVGEEYQGRGYGRAAMMKVIERRRSAAGCRRIHTSYDPTNAVAEALYESLGFRKTGEVVHGELVTVLEVSAEE